MSSARPATLALAVALLASALARAGVDRSQPPAPGPVRPLQLPPVQKHRLSNGLSVRLVELHEVPVAELALVLRSGAAADPGERPGLAAMTASMLDEGAGGKDALALADAVDFLGASLDTFSSWDYSLVRLHVPVVRLEAALPVMADVALRPEFPEKELERLRKEALTRILQSRDEPRALAGYAFARAVFGSAHRYGLPAGGTAAALAALSVPELREFHSRHFRPGNAALIVVGDVSAAVLPLLERAFGGWAGGGAPAAPLAPPAPLEARRVWLVDKPGAAQSVIRIGRVGPDRSTPDYHAREVMNTLLGGSFTSRLNDNLREQHGYAYGAGSFFSYRRSAGEFVAAADVQTPSTAEALSEFFKELTRIGAPATPEEVERARNYLALGFAGDFETTRQIAGRLAEQVVYELPDDFYASFVPRVLAVGGEEVRQAGAGLDPERMAVVVVGDREKIEAPIRALGLGPLELLTVEELMGPPPQVD